MGPVSLGETAQKVAHLEKTIQQHHGAIGALLALVSGRVASQHLGEVGPAISADALPALQEWERATSILQLAILDANSPNAPSADIAAGVAMVREAFTKAHEERS